MMEGWQFLHYKLNVLLCDRKTDVYMLCSFSRS